MARPHRHWPARSFRCNGTCKPSAGFWAVSIPLPMPSKLIAATTSLLLLGLLLAAPALARSSNANVAALQVALKALHRYHGGIDGMRGPGTRAATKAFQRRHHLHADGVAGPRTRRALGVRGRPVLGRRIIKRGNRGWDVAALQFMLRRRGYSPGTVDGGFGLGTLAALKRFQAAAGIGVDGRAGGGTLRALRHHQRSVSSGGHSASGTPSGPVRFLRPVHGAMGDGFGYPGGRRHDGIDFPEPYGTSIGAAGVGTVVFAGWNSGGYGNLTIIQHRLGFQTWYAHQSHFYVHQGQRVAGGTRIGAVGSTGRSTGPHLHFEVRLNGTPINPLPYLLSSYSLARRLFRAAAHPQCMDHGSARRTPVGHNGRTAQLSGC
jgi:peptidoglycan hydrolase-like protein with peptidoglycan-binding domain